APPQFFPLFLRILKKIDERGLCEFSDKSHGLQWRLSGTGCIGVPRSRVRIHRNFVMQIAFHSILRGVLSALPLALLSGCNDCEVRSCRESVDARLAAPPEKTRENPSPSPPHVNAVPIRRTLAGTSSAANDLAHLQLQLQSLPLSFFTASRLNDGRIQLSAADAFGSSAAAADWLQKNGFTKTNTGNWLRQLAPAQVPQLRYAVE